MSQLSTKVNDSSSQTVPYSRDSEMMVLGCLLTNHHAFQYGCESLGPDDFFFSEHKIIFDSLRRICRKGMSADTHIVCEDLSSHSQLERVGEANYITALAQYAGTSAYIEEYCALLKNQSYSRKAIDLFSEAQGALLKGSDHPGLVFENFYKRFIDLGKRYTSLRRVSLGEVISGSGGKFPHLIDQIESRYRHCQEHGKPFISGIPTGFEELDAQVSLLEKTHFVVLAGRPAMGKTALALTIASHVCLEQGLPIAFISLEMSSSQLAERILSIRTKISGERLKRGTLSQEELWKLRNEEPKLQKAPFFIDDSGVSSVYQVMSRVRQLKEEEGIQLAVIDYLQLLGTGGRADSRQYEVAEVSRSLKMLAMELSIPIICVAQLSRKVEDRTSKRPVMSDLRDSGQIEQDSDSILFVYRPSYYDPCDRPGQADVMIAKNRHGPTTKVTLAFESDFGCFTHLSPVSPTW